jgi:hypothetical protein
MIPSQAQLATRYVQQTLAVLAWPVGFAVTELVAYHLLTGLRGQPRGRLRPDAGQIDRGVVSQPARRIAGGALAHHRHGRHAVPHAGLICSGSPVGAAAAPRCNSSSPSIRSPQMHEDDRRPAAIAAAAAAAAPGKRAAAPHPATAHRPPPPAPPRRHHRPHRRRPRRVPRPILPATRAAAALGPSQLPAAHLKLTPCDAMTTLRETPCAPRATRNLPACRAARGTLSNSLPIMRWRRACGASSR